MIKIIKYFLTICSALLMSCSKPSQSIPYVSVNITIYPSTPQYYKLNSVSGWQYVSGGVNGIIVYRKDVNEFIAYERTSTYEPTQNCVCAVDTSNNVVVQDPCSGSKFLLTDGSTIQGPASKYLLRYSTTWDGNVLRIVN